MNKELTNDSEEQLYKEAIAEPLDSKVKKAIGLLQIMCAGKREREIAPLFFWRKRFYCNKTSCKYGRN